MKNFKKLSQTELQNTNGGIVPIITGPITLPMKVAKWVTGLFK